MDPNETEGKTKAIYIHDDVQAIVEALQAENGIGSFSGALRFIVRDWAKTRETNAKKINRAVRSIAGAV